MIKCVDVEKKMAEKCVLTNSCSYRMEDLESVTPKKTWAFLADFCWKKISSEMITRRSGRITTSFFEDRSRGRNVKSRRLTCTSHPHFKWSKWLFPSFEVQNLPPQSPPEERSRLLRNELLYTTDFCPTLETDEGEIISQITPLEPRRSFIRDDLLRCG